MKEKAERKSLKMWRGRRMTRRMECVIVPTEIKLK